MKNIILLCSILWTYYGSFFYNQEWYVFFLHCQQSVQLLVQRGVGGWEARGPSLPQTKLGGNENIGQCGHPSVSLVGKKGEPNTVYGHIDN